MSPSPFRLRGISPGRTGAGPRWRRRAAGCGSWIAPCPSLRRETFSSAITGRSGRVSPPSSRPGAVLQAWLDGRAGKAPGLDPSVFRDKIVLIGATAAGAFDLRATPFSSSDPGVFLHATALSNVLEGYFLRPGGGAANAAALVLISVFAALVMSAPIKFRWRVTAIIIGGLLFGGAVTFLTVSFGLWVEMAVPSLAFAMKAIGALGLNYVREGRQRALIKNIFTHYMNPQLVELLVSEPNRVNLGGERRELSVFFSDLENFTSLSERLEPEQLVALLNIYLAEMTDIILAYDGYLDKYEGDAIMAAFGTPISHPDHAHRACWAALDNAARLPRLNQELRDGSYFRRKGGRPLDFPRNLDWELVVRVGVNSGPMIAGNMGSLARMDYTVMGDAVNLAARLEGANKTFGPQIMVGEETVRLAGGGVEVRLLDRLRVKGKEAPVQVYELMGRGGELSPERYRLRDRFGRAHAAYLARRWEEAAEGFRDALAIDPADGPSRLYLGRCESYAKAPPPGDWGGVFVMTAK